MRSFAKYLAIFMVAISLVASPVAAQDPTPEFNATTYERHRLPEGQRCLVDGVPFQCFSLDEYVELLEMDVDLRFFESAYPNALSRIASLEGVAVQLNLALDAANSQIDTLSTERDRLFSLWSEENRLRLEAENRPMFGSWIAWGLAAAEAIAILVLSLVMAAQ